MSFDDVTLAKMTAGLAVVLAAVLAALVGFYSQIKIKQFDLRAQTRKDMATQRLAFYIPLLRFCYEFDGRIGRILSRLDTDWLRASHLEKIRRNEGFAKDPCATGYFIMSSVYVFACFFGWTEAIKKGIDATQPLSERGWVSRWLSGVARLRGRLWGWPATSRVYFFDRDISLVRRLFQHQELFHSYSTATKQMNPRDAHKLHRHFQHSIGEMMLQADGALLRCKTFREFSEAYRDEQFRYWFVPLEELFTDLSDFDSKRDVETQAALKNDIRPLRLLAIRYWSRVLMRNLGKELGIDTPPPDEVIDRLSNGLKATITSVKLEQLELFLVQTS